MNSTSPTLPFWIGVLALAQQATRDSLTGLYNRRYFDETLADHTAAAQRYQRALSLVLFDLDHFKQINDTLGHPAGDETLKRFAQLLRTNARNADIVCRIGGDEFAVLLPETEKAQAQFFAERITRAAKAEPDPIFVTAGLSALPSDLMTTADTDLIKGKRHARVR